GVPMLCGMVGSRVGVLLRMTEPLRRNGRAQRLCCGGVAALVIGAVPEPARDDARQGRLLPPAEGEAGGAQGIPAVGWDPWSPASRGLCVRGGTALRPAPSGKTRKRYLNFRRFQGRERGEDFCILGGETVS